MSRDLATAGPWEALDDALTRMRQDQCRVLIVVDNEKVVGLLTTGNIGELVALEAASRQSRRAWNGLKPKAPVSEWGRGQRPSPWEARKWEGGEEVNNGPGVEAPAPTPTGGGAE